MPAIVAKVTNSMPTQPRTSFPAQPLGISQGARAAQTIPRTVVALAMDYQEGEQVASHFHPRAQLVYGVSGVMQVQTPDSVWTLPPQRALWIPPNVPHQINMMSPVNMRTIYVEQSAAEQLGTRVKAISVSGLMRELILSLLAQPMEYPVPGRGEHMAILLLMEIAEAGTLAVDIPWPRDRRLQTACQAIMKAPGTPRTMEQLAEMAGASPRTLIRLFPRETGLKYHQWCQQVHLSDALCRLARGESIARIAAALGYASPSAFSAMFRRALGAAPSQYMTPAEPAE